MSIPPFARDELRKWHTGAEWKLRTTAWLNELACKYGKENFRLRKGPGGPDIKVVCEELLPMANLLRDAPDLREWQGSLAAPGAKADAWLRASPEHPPQPVQIVGAFNGAEFAEQMKMLNADGRTPTQATSAVEIEGEHNAYVVKAIEKKKAKGYPPDYWLLVAIDDIFLPVEKLELLTAQAVAAATSAQFQRVYIAGMNSSSSGARRLA